MLINLRIEDRYNSLDLISYGFDGQFFVARVGSAIYGLGLNLENFP